MAETTVLSGSYIDNWEAFKNIFTSKLDPDGDGEIGNDARGPKVSRVDRRLDRLDKFFSDSFGDALTISGSGVPTREDFIKAVDPDGDGKIGTDGAGKSVERALRIYDRALRSYDRNTDTSVTSFATPESLSLGVEFTPTPPADPVVFGGPEPTARFTDLVGTGSEVITSELPDTLDVGGLSSDSSDLDTNDGLEAFKRGLKR